jgi:hypothetical protein
MSENVMGEESLLDGEDCFHLPYIQYIFSTNILYGAFLKYITVSNVLVTNT